MTSSYSPSKLRHKDSTTPSPRPPPPPLSTNKQYHVSPSKISKQEKELKLLTDMVQALAQKLKKRDMQEQQLNEKVDKVIEVTLQLESAEERLVDAVAENQTLSRRIENLQSAIDLKNVRGPTTSKNDVVEIPNRTHSSEQTIDEAEFHEVKHQRDGALLKASVMAIAVAESQSESDELRDQLAAVIALLEQQKSGSSSVPSPALTLPRNLVNLWMSSKKQPEITIV
jgi:hypothetical protein